MDRDALNALREVASAAYAYLLSPPHVAMEFRAELVASLETLVAALKEPIPNDADRDDPIEDDEPVDDTSRRRALRRFVEDGKGGGRVVRLTLVKRPPEGA
jgi:hypothetical protein